MWYHCHRNLCGWPCSPQSKCVRFLNGGHRPHLHSTQTSRPSPVKVFWPQSDLVRLVGAAPTVALGRVPPIWTAKYSINVTRPAKPYKRFAELFNFPIFYIKHLRPGLKANWQASHLFDSSAEPTPVVEILVCWLGDVIWCLLTTGHFRR